MRKLQLSAKESDIQNSICSYLELRNHCFWRSNNIPAFSWNADGSVRMRSMPKFTPKGLPDITLISGLKGGRYIGIEVKRPNMPQSDDQRLIQRWIEQNGGEYYVVHSLDEVQALKL